MKKLSTADKNGIYLTLIIHLSVLIILLVTQIGFSLSKEDSFVIDFSKQEEAQQKKEAEEFKENINKRVEDLISAAQANGTPIRNVAVNRGALKDDRNTDADDLYKDAEKLQKDLNTRLKADDAADLSDETADLGGEKRQEDKTSSYSGPSVVSYELGNRHASRLPIPAYRCMGSGTVTVIIGVDNSGKVIYAKVQDAVSDDDNCLRNFAVRAARMSLFSSDPKAPAKQMGNIVYSFIAQ